MTWPLHQMTWNDMTCHAATNHSSSPHVTSQPTTLLHLTPQATSWHQNRSHYHRGTAESLCTAKQWFGHGAGRSPCAHSIGKFFLCSIVLFSSETSAPGLARELLVYWCFWKLHIDLQIKTSKNSEKWFVRVYKHTVCVFNFRSALSCADANTYTYIYWMYCHIS